VVGTVDLADLRQRILDRMRPCVRRVWMTPPPPPARRQMKPKTVV
jgi:hypothetical protein